MINQIPLRILQFHTKCIMSTRLSNMLLTIFTQQENLRLHLHLLGHLRFGVLLLLVLGAELKQLFDGSLLRLFAWNVCSIVFSVFWKLCGRDCDAAASCCFMFDLSIEKAMFGAVCDCLICCLLVFATYLLTSETDG